MSDATLPAAEKCLAATAGAVVLGYAAYELLRYATGQAIVAGSPLPTLTVFLLLLAGGALVYQFNRSS